MSTIPNPPRSTPAAARPANYESFQRALELHKTARDEALRQREAIEASLKKRVRKTPVEAEKLSEIAKERAAEADRAAKPVFKTKAQRQKEALERLKARRAAESSNQPIAQAAPSSSSRAITERGSRRVATSSIRRSQADAAVLEQIKEQYLGMKKKRKKRVLPPSQKFKFNFDWDASEDTMDVTNPLYANKIQSSLMFGRGFIAGTDRREQRKQMSFYDELRARREAGREIKIMDLRDQDRVREREAKARAKAARDRTMNRHWKDKSLVEMTARDWRIFREDYNISTRGTRVPHPVRFWSESKLPPSILRTLEKVGYTEPSPIQRASIPVGLQNRDLVGIAQTGSGKTAAFLLPLFVYVDRLPRLTPLLAQNGPYAVVMAPARELAQQIADECNKLSDGLGIRNVAIIGGLSIQDQGFFVREGAEICIATPGRLHDCIERHYLVLNQCNYVILDEADRMIDMNFGPQIEKILDAMPSSNLRPLEESQWDENKTYRQTIMFSATMPPKVELLAKKYLRNPVFIAIGDRSGHAAATVQQTVVWCTSDSAKRTRVRQLLLDQEPPIIVFCNEKAQCDAVARWISSIGISAVVIHGRKRQEQRMENLKLFKQGKVGVLVATDVIGRGIDVSGVKLVINYDVPSSIQRYTHRIGRTGRAGQRGIAVSLITPQDTAIMYDLKQMLEAAKQPVPSELARHPDARHKPTQAGGKRRKDAVVYAKR